MIKLKRVYGQPSADDGYRILVDRLWPRGLTKEKAALDLWLKDVGPSNELRKWFGHDPVLWDEFKRRYFQELAEKTALIQQIQEKADAGMVTLVYAAHDSEHNNAVALAEYLAKK